MTADPRTAPPPAPAAPDPRCPGVRLGTPVTVRVPATSANLGPGFDSLGLALDIDDVITVEALPPGTATRVVVRGEGAGTVPEGEENLVVRSIRAGLAHAAAGRPALRVTCRNAIPHGRGLGSSASAIVAGLVAARGLLQDAELLDDATVLDLATAAEGHPDNASAALFGGFTVSWTDPAPFGRHGGPVQRARTLALAVDPRVRVVACIPDGELATSRARAMLPAHVPHGDAAFTAGRAALLVEALTRRPDLLFPATQERLHQEQRAPAMPATVALVHAVRAAGAAAVVSGAGPSALVLGVGDEPLDAVRDVLSRRAELGRWQVLTPAVATRGAELVPDADTLHPCRH
jgi:homoserine kinase